MDNAEKWDTNKRSLGWGSLGQSKSAMPERTLSGTMSSCSTRWISTQRFHPGVVQKKILGEFTNKTSNIFGHLTQQMSLNFQRISWANMGYFSLLFWCWPCVSWWLNRPWAPVAFATKLFCNFWPQLCGLVYFATQITRKHMTKRMFRYLNISKPKNPWAHCLD